MGLLREIKAIISRVAKYLAWNLTIWFLSSPLEGGEQGHFFNEVFIVIYTVMVSVTAILSCCDLGAIIPAYSLGLCPLC